MLGSTFFVTIIAAGIALYATLTPTPEDQIKQELQFLPQPNLSSPWYEYSYRDSSATGGCTATSMDKWFGLNTQNDTETLVAWVSHQLTLDGWQSTGNHWLKEVTYGRYVLDIEVITDTTSIKSQQWFYQIPNDALQQARNYQMAYRLELSFVSREAIAQCFGK